VEAMRILNQGSEKKLMPKIYDAMTNQDKSTLIMKPRVPSIDFLGRFIGEDNKNEDH